MLPYWESDIIPDLATGKTVLVTAHGNSLRALVKHLDGISDDDIAELNIPTGIPLVYELDDDFMPLEPGRATSTPRPPPPVPRQSPRRARSSRPGAHAKSEGSVHPLALRFDAAAPGSGRRRAVSGSQSPVARYCTFLAIDTAWSAKRSW